MIKNNKALAVISSILIILPAIFGAIFYDSLPDNMSTHFTLDGESDGVMEKPLAVFLLPAVLLILHWICLLITNRDKRVAGQSKKITTLIFFIMPATSLFTNAIIYITALDLKLDIMTLTFAFIGILFAVIGNYLPKAKKNFYFGIRIPSTLSSEQNWNKTHKLAGKVWFFGGIVILISAFLPTLIAISVSAITLFVLTLVPIAYSYVISKRLGVSEDSTLPDRPARKAVFIIPIVIILVAVAFITLVGDINVTLENEGIRLDSLLYSASGVEYDEIINITYSNSFDKGFRKFGFGTLKLSMGKFYNDEFHDYTIYAYNKNPECIIVETEKGVLVFNLKTPSETQKIYGKLIDKLS